MVLSAEILQARLGRITSSVAAGALGVNPRMSPLDAWMRITGKIKEIEPNKAMARGHRLEDITLDYPAEELGLRRAKAEFRRHPDYEMFGDSADAVYYAAANDSAPLYVGEAKTVARGALGDYGEEGTDQIPNGALVQCHWHLAHWPEVSTCIVPVLLGGYDFEFRVYYVRRNQQFEAALLEDLARWHRDYVIADKPPPATVPEDTAHLLTLHPNSTKGLLKPTPEIHELVLAKDAAAQAKKAAEESEELAKVRLREILGEHEGVEGDGWKVRYKRNRPSLSTDWEKIARDLLRGMPQAEREEIVERNTIEKQGNRPLVVTVA